MDKDDQRGDEEIARYRDEIIRRMANTAPQPKTKSEKRANPKKRKRTPKATQR